MKEVFADTYYFLALLSPNDEGHAGAELWSARSGLRMLTTAWILAEVADGLAGPPTRHIARAWLQGIHKASHVRIVPSSDRWFQVGVQLFLNRPDKAWSLTDCISFCVMRHTRVNDALTADKHFEQAGFRALLAQPRA